MAHKHQSLVNGSKKLILGQYLVRVINEDFSVIIDLD